MHRHELAQAYQDVWRIWFALQEAQGRRSGETIVTRLADQVTRAWNQARRLSRWSLLEQAGLDYARCELCITADLEGGVIWSSYDDASATLATLSWEQRFEALDCVHYRVPPLVVAGTMTCDRCGTFVPRNNCAIELEMVGRQGRLATVAEMLAWGTRHLLPTSSCPGSPSRAQYLLEQPRDPDGTYREVYRDHYRAAYAKLRILVEQGDERIQRGL